MEGRGTVWTPFKIAHSHKKKYLDCFLYYSKKVERGLHDRHSDEAMGWTTEGLCVGCRHWQYTFYCRELPDRLWILSYLLLNRYKLFSVGKRPELKLFTHPGLMSRLTRSRTTAPLPHMSSFLSHGHLYIYLSSMMPRITLLLWFNWMRQSQEHWKQDQPTEWVSESRIRRSVGKLDTNFRHETLSYSVRWVPQWNSRLRL